MVMITWLAIDASIPLAGLLRSKRIRTLLLTITTSYIKYAARTAMYCMWDRLKGN